MPLGPDSAVVVITPGGGHVQRLIPLISGLASRGTTVHVWTRVEARSAVEKAGGCFRDLYGPYPVEAVDRESVPMPIRLVTFAAAYADSLTTDVARLRPSLLVYDSFAVIGPLIARRLGIPYVGMRAGHAQVPSRAIAAARREPGVRISNACAEAVERLRGEHGVSTASPFSYLDGMSPHLNLYPEPPPFLDESDRQAFEPLAFFGSLAPEVRESASRTRPLASRDGRPRVYMSFGTVIWRYHAEVATAALSQLAAVFAQSGADVLVSAGGQTHAWAGRAIDDSRVRVESFVDQWGALKDADLFVTHHGLNSTHEAIYHRVPMLSYPFLGDQPALARRCGEMGLAVPLVSAPREPIDPEVVREQVDAILTDRDRMTRRLDEARTWELETIANRESVIDRVVALAS